MDLPSDGATCGDATLGLSSGRAEMGRQVCPTSVSGSGPLSLLFPWARRAPLATFSRGHSNAGLVGRAKEADPTSPRAPLGGTYMWPHAPAIGHVQQWARRVSLLLLSRAAAASSTFSRRRLGKTAISRVRVAPPPQSSRRRPTDGLTNRGRPLMASARLRLLFRYGLLSPALAATSRRSSRGCFLHSSGRAVRRNAAAGWG